MGSGRYDVIVVGGGFAGVTAARESARDGRSTLLLEARDRIGGRTWTASWRGHDIEYGGGWVHWHQPFTFSEITRAGLGLELSGDPDVTAWYVGEERRTGTIGERDAIANAGWVRFVEGVEESLPNPHDPRHAIDRLSAMDALTIADRVEQLALNAEQHDVLWAELESLAHGPLDEAGAVSVLRWHALSGYSLALTQYTGGRVTLTTGTRGLLEAIASQAPFETRRATPVAAVRRRSDGVEIETRAGEVLGARRAVVAVPLNTLAAIEFDPPLSEGKQAGIALGQASRGIKIFIHAEGDPAAQNSIRPGHPFGYLDTEFQEADGSQIMIGFGCDAATCDATDLAGVQASLDEIMPGYRAVAATAHDWLADEFSNGTWAIHRPGWYTHHYAEMRRPEGPVLLAGSDLAAGWAGFIDGAIETGIRAGMWLRELTA